MDKEKHTSSYTRSIKKDRVIENNLLHEHSLFLRDVLGFKEIYSIIFET